MPSVYLKSVTIRRFKQFEDVVFDLSTTREYSFNQEVLTEDGRFVKTALVYGQNGAGKSNLGLAVMDLTLHLTDAEKNLGLYSYYLRADSDVQNAEFIYEFVHGDSVYRYEYVKQTPEICIAERFVVDDDLVFSIDRSTITLETPGSEKYEFSTLLMNDVKLSLLKYISTNSNLSENNPIACVMRFVRGMLFFKRVDDDNCFIGLKSQKDYLFGYIIKNNYLKEFEEMLNKLGIQETLVAENEQDYQTAKILFKHKYKNLPFEVASSSGTKAILLLFYWLKHFEEASFVFIDDFDAFYHSELAEQVYKLLKTQTGSDHLQCVMTTHNTNLLSNKIGRPDSFYIVTPQKIAAMSSWTSREIREGNNIENLYLGKAFGVL